VIPEDLRYTTDHEWVRSEGETVRVGVTDYAQEALGDIVFVTLPEAGTQVTAGDTCGEVESTYSVSDIYAPLSGTVVERNEALDASPELVNSDPYGDGWMLTIRPDDTGAADTLLDAATYQAGLDTRPPHRCRRRAVPVDPDRAGT
jgi:glycine cleavage system H protein